MPRRRTALPLLSGWRRKRSAGRRRRARAEAAGLRCPARAAGAMNTACSAMPDRTDAVASGGCCATARRMLRGVGADAWSPVLARAARRPRCPRIAVHGAGRCRSPMAAGFRCMARGLPGAGADAGILRAQRFALELLPTAAPRILSATAGMRSAAGAGGAPALDPVAVRNGWSCTGPTSTRDAARHERAQPGRRVWAAKRN